MAESGRWSAMKKFADQMKVLAPAPVVLQPEPVYKVVDNANAALNLVVTMIREHDGNIYVIAARVTEPDPVPKFKYQGSEPDSIEFNFQVSDLTEKAAGVIHEGRAVSVTNGLFTDTFAGFAMIASHTLLLELMTVLGVEIL